MGRQPGMGPDPEPSGGRDLGQKADRETGGGEVRGVKPSQGPSPEVLARLERERKLRLKQERFKEHRQKAANRTNQTIEMQDLDDIGQGQVNRSLTTMKKYRDQSGMAKWDIQEVKDNPQAGLSRIAAIREGLEDDEETYNSYLDALRAQLKDNHYSLSVLDVTAPANKGQKFRGDLNKGFRMLTASL
ncbi:hypothetical protein [Curvivirga sp.]|uniref:hypothetical protein n=1 Tax=Curvivirga sp. TaxID=2856848 RepID=UPI003B5C452B